MYIVWQDAQFNSKLVKSGFKMTQLRAAFTLTTAAKWRTGIPSRELVKMDSKKLGQQLYGSKKKIRAEVGADIFADRVKDIGEVASDDEGLRKRDRRVREQEEI